MEADPEELDNVIDTNGDIARDLLRTMIGGTMEDKWRRG